MLPGDPAAFMRAVLPQPDALLVPPATDSTVGLLAPGRSWTLGELVAAAGHPPAQCRVLTTRPLDLLDGVLDAVVRPLVADGSAVLVINADPAALVDRARTERVTHTADVDLPGLPRLR